MKTNDVILIIISLIMAIAILVSGVYSLIAYSRLRKTGVKVKFSFLSMPFYLNWICFENNDVMPDEIRSIIKLITRLQIVIIVCVPVFVLLVQTK